MTTDFGRTWVPFPGDTHKTLRDIAMRGNDMIAVGDSALAVWVDSEMQIFDRPLWKNWIGAPPDPWPALHAGAVIDPVTAVAAGDAGMLAYTTDQGLSWQRATSDAGAASRFTSIAFGDSLAGVAAASNGVMSRSTDGGRTWTVTRQADASGASRIRASVKALDALHYVCLYLCDTTGATAATPIVRSDDGGRTWYEAGTVSQPVGAGLHLFGPDRWATVGGHCYSTTSNGGVTWTIDTLGYQLRDLHFRTDLLGQIACDDAILMSVDGGAVWEKRTTVGTDYHAVHSAGPGLTWAAGGGGHIYHSETDKVVVGIESAPAPQASAFTLDPVWPNPASTALGVAQTRFTLAVGARVRIELRDLLGRLVRVVSDETRAPGAHTVRFATAGLQPGTYMLALHPEGMMPKMRMVMIAK